MNKPFFAFLLLLVFSCSPDEETLTTTTEPIFPIYLDSNGITIKAYDFALVGNEYELNGVSYTVVDDSTIDAQIANANVNLCTTFVNNMSELFKDNSSFNSDINFWDTSSVTTMNSIFENATAFNQDIGNWDTSSVTSMDYIFFNATSFTQDLAGWCVSNITSEPNNFATNSTLTNPNKPVWGTCP